MVGAGTVRDGKNRPTPGREASSRCVPPVAKVEPITTARALRGPFDYLRPDGRRRRVGARRAVRRARRRRRGHGARGRVVDRRRSPRRAAPRARPRPAARARRARRLDGDRVLLDAGPRARRSSPPAGRGRGAKVAWWAPRPARPRARAADAAEADARGRTRRRRAAAPLFRPPAGAAGRPPRARAAARGRRPAGAAPPRRARARHARAPRRCAGTSRTTPSARAARSRPPLTPTRRGRSPRSRTQLARDDPEPLLLHGVTGSGKTEIYLRAAATALQRGLRRHRARPRDRPHAADRLALRRSLRRHRRRPALQALRGRAPRRVEPPAQRRRARLHRPALGRLRADRAPRPDRPRRGARRLLQARGRPALRRPPRRRAARARRPARCCSPAARRRGPSPSTRCAACACPRASMARRCRR